MATADKAKMIVELDFVAGKFTAGIKNASASMGRLEGAIKKSHAASTALGIGLYQLGAKAASAFGGAITSGISLAAELEDANRATAGALEASGLAAKLSAEDIRKWSEAIEEAVQFTFDDKEIQRAANTLISFGDIASTSLEQAMTVATNLAPRFGGVEAAAESLAKSLVDPTTATRILKTAGIALTAEQKTLIKSLVDTGRKAEAQAILLDLLSEKTKDLAKASAGPYRQAMNLMAESIENVKIILGQAFLPVLIKVGNKLGEVMATDKFKRSVDELGKGLASAFEAVVSFAEKIPWEVIADSMRIAATGAKALLNAFTSLPPWVQTAVITGWGFNKISGGALAGLLGGLSKGIGELVMEKFKGALGITAAAVYVNGPIAGAGDVPAAGGAAGRVGTIASAVSKVFMVGMAVTAAAVLGKELLDQSGAIREQGAALQGSAKTFGNTASAAELTAAIQNIDDQFRDPLNFAALSVTNVLNGGLDTLRATRADLVASLAAVKAATASGDERTASRIGSLDATIARKNFSPTFSPKITVPVYVTSTVSVRNNRVATSVSSRYSGNSRIYEP